MLGITLTGYTTLSAEAAGAAAGAGGTASVGTAGGNATTSGGTTSGTISGNITSPATGTSPGTTTNGVNMGDGGSVNGNSTAGASNWNAHNQYWQSQYSSRPYYTKGTHYSTYQPAYQFGYNMYNQSGGKPYQSLNQTQLQNQWMQNRGNSNLSWSQAQGAIQDSYNRMYSNQGTTNTTPANNTTAVTR